MHILPRTSPPYLQDDRSAPPAAATQVACLIIFLADDKMGACILELKDCLVNWTRWLPISYVPTECEVMNGTSEGKRLRREGYVPNYPIFCIPGFASSALSCEESTESLWRGERVWLNLTGLVKGKCTGIAVCTSPPLSTF